MKQKRIQAQTKKVTSSITSLFAYRFYFNYTSNECVALTDVSGGDNVFTALCFWKVRKSLEHRR